MPAQLVSVAEAALGPLPTSTEFLDRLVNVGSALDAAPADLGLFGQTFSESPRQPPGTEKNQKVALRAALDFQEVCKHKNVHMKHLDEWFMAFAKWTLHFDVLLDDDGARREAREQRKQLCVDVGVVMREWSPQTLKADFNILNSEIGRAHV